MIEARGLIKRYGATAAVNDLSFTIRPGLVTGFLGPNGAGKTTTMRLILGLDYPSAGTVTVNGQPYAQLPAPMHEVGALLDAGARRPGVRHPLGRGSRTALVIAGKPLCRPATGPVGLPMLVLALTRQERHQMSQARALTKRSCVFTVTALAGLLMIGGCASAATKASTPASPDAAHTSPSTSASPAGPQASRASGPVQITGYSKNDGPESTVILTGVIGDFGVAVRTYANGKIERNYNQLDLTVTHGSFRLSIAGIENDLVSAFRYFPSNTSTCSGIVTATGTTPIVAGSGTGAYKGISGNFKTTITIHEVDSWPKCTALLAEDIFMTGSGTVSFG